MVLEDSTRRAAETMAKLLESLCSSVVVSADQLKQGAKRVFDNMGDIVLGKGMVYFTNGDVRRSVADVFSEHKSSRPSVRRSVSRSVGRSVTPVVGRWRYRVISLRCRILLSFFSEMA